LIILNLQPSLVVTGRDHI